MYEESVIDVGYAVWIMVMGQFRVWGLVDLTSFMMLDE
jgi:hypothetical protein